MARLGVFDADLPAGGLFDTDLATSGLFDPDLAAEPTSGGISGTLSATLATATASVSGNTSISGSASADLAPASSSSTGSLRITGSATATLSSPTLDAFGSGSSSEPHHTVYIYSDHRSAEVSASARSVDVDAEARDVTVGVEIRAEVVPSEARETMSDFVIFRHAPGASRVYRLVWADAESDPVVSETFVVSGPDAALTVAASASSGVNRQFRATGGTSGAAYDVVNTVTFSSGDVDSRTVRLVCTPR